MAWKLTTTIRPVFQSGPFDAGTDGWDFKTAKAERVEERPKLLVFCCK